MRPTLILAILASATLLAGCNANTENDGVRAGPQAVHPSTSPLAQGIAAPAPVGTHHSGAPVLVESYHPNRQDGSQPIVD